MVGGSGRTPTALIKRSLKAEILKPRYRDAFGPVVNTVLLEQGLHGDKTAVKESLGGGSIVRYVQVVIGS